MANAQTASALDVLWRQAPGGELLDLGRVYRGPLALSKLHTSPGRVLSRREATLLGIFALVLHGAVIYWINSSHTPVLPVVPPEIPPMTIEFSQPAPPVVEPPLLRQNPWCNRRSHHLPWRTNWPPSHRRPSRFPSPNR